MAENELHWSEVDRDTNKSLCDVLENIRRDLAKNPLSRARVLLPAMLYPEDPWEQQQFDMRARDRADRWVQSAFDIYSDAVTHLGFEPSAHGSWIWYYGLSGFLKHRLKPVLEDAFGVTAEDRLWLETAPRSPSKGATRARFKRDAILQVVEAMDAKWGLKLCPGHTSPSIEAARLMSLSAAREHTAQRIVASAGLPPISQGGAPANARAVEPAGPRTTDEASATFSPVGAKAVQPHAKSCEFWRARRTGTWTIRIPSISRDAVSIADHRSVNLDYLCAALKAGRGGAELSQIADEGGMRGRADAGGAPDADAQTADAGLSSQICGQRVLDGRVLKQARDRLEELEAEARKAEQDGHPDIAVAQRQEAEDLRNHIKKQTKPFQGARREKTDADRTANAVQQGIKRALGAISKGNQQVGRFLRANLKLEGGRCSTKCDTSDWKFHE